jgi:hypothetical protein
MLYLVLPFLAAAIVELPYPLAIVVCRRTELQHHHLNTIKLASFSCVELKVPIVLCKWTKFTSIWKVFVTGLLSDLVVLTLCYSS